MGRKLNILNIGHTPPRLGGSAFVNIETMIALAERGHKVRCITQLSESHLAQPDYDMSWRDTSVAVHHVVSDYIPAYQPLTQEQLSEKKELILNKFHELVDKDKPDVIMIGHESYCYFANEEAKKIGIPLVQVLHGTPTHLIDKGIYPEDLTKQFIEGLNYATLVVGVSKYLANIVKSHGIRQVSYIHNGTNTRMFKPSRKKDEKFLHDLGIELGDRVIMHASNLKPIKRPLDIVESAPYALNVNHNLRYVIVGDGPLRVKMEEKARELGVYDYFRFIGRVEFNEMPKYFQNSDVFLLPSETEGFGRVLREAQACKSVPVASNVGPMPEVIEDNETGRLFEKGNVNDLASKVVELSTDNEKRSLMARKAQQVAKDYDTVAMITDYVHALSQPLNFLEYRVV